MNWQDNMLARDTGNTLVHFWKIEIANLGKVYSAEFLKETLNQRNYFV